VLLVRRDFEDGKGVAWVLTRQAGSMLGHRVFGVTVGVDAVLLL